ncbi:MAG: FxsA family protein [Alphaproteobacteria bacterium]|nr:FxsA family protein [Alphaproteobacteria bacterium]
MPLLILLGFIALPLLEIGVFIWVGDEIGILATIATTVLTAIIGAALVRAQGLATLNKVSTSLNQGEMPLRPVFDGACQLIAGALLLAPGFITDTIGLLLFIPVFRTILLVWVISRTAVTVVGSDDKQGKTSNRHDYDVEGDYQDVTPNQPLSLPDERDKES